MKVDEAYATGIRILPGQWRPHYPFEQIAWVSPPWPSHDYVWLDFPEAIFSDTELLYLSHVNPQFPDLSPGEEAQIHGQLIFFEGSLDALAEQFTTTEKQTL